MGPGELIPGASVLGGTSMHEFADAFPESRKLAWSDEFPEQNFDTHQWLQYFLDNSNSLGEAATLVLHHLMKVAGIEEKWDLALKKRLYWVDGTRWTLEEAANLVGVTRERMRQVQNKLEAATLHLASPPKILDRVLNLGMRCVDIEDFFVELKEKGYSGPEEDWSKQSLLELFSKLGTTDQVEALAKLFGELSPAPRSESLEKAIRGARYRMLGVVDVERVIAETGRNRRDIENAIRALYSVVVGSSRLLLAVKNPPGGLVMSVGKQLLVNPVAVPQSLREGVDRYSKYRGVEFSVSASDFETLLAELFGSPPRIEDLPHALNAGIDLSAHEFAFVRAFERTGRNSLHRDELVEAAAESGTSPASAGVYLSTSPIMRSSRVKSGYYCLV